MRGEHRRQETMFSYVAPEARVPERHPLRPIRAMVDQALAALDAEFEALYSHTGAPFDSARVPAARHAAADPVLGALRAAAGRADRLQPAVPLVHRTVDG
jgi:hypothetical protein